MPVVVIFKTEVVSLWLLCKMRAPVTEASPWLTWSCSFLAIVVFRFRRVEDCSAFGSRAAGFGDAGGHDLLQSELYVLSAINHRTY